MNKVKVKRELLADWLAALRSGKYQQGKSTLVDGPDKNTPTYCCLGVKVHLEDPKKCDEYFAHLLDGADEFAELQNYSQWATEYRIDNDFLKFLNHQLTEHQKVENLLTSLNDGAAIKFVGDDVLKNVIKNFVSKRDNIAGKDSGIYTFTFPQIADFIEEELVEYID